MPTALYPPGPNTGLGVRTMLAMRRNPLAFLSALAHVYGPISHFTLGRQHMVLINEPDAIRDILITNNRHFAKGRGLERAKRLLGEGLLTSEVPLHTRQRRLVQPAFYRKRIAGYGDDMVAAAAALDADWAGLVDADRSLDITRAMAHLTLVIVGKTLFGADVGAEGDEIRAALGSIFDLFNAGWLPFAALLDQLPLARNRRFEQARARLDQTIYGMIAERRRSSDDRGDLLSMLLQARDSEGDGTGMTDTELRDECMTLFLAGHETTANALTWTWYLLGQHPAVEARLHAELDAVLGGRNPSTADLPELHFTEAVVAEAMRLYPPAWIIGRRALDDYQLDQYVLPRGTIVVMSQWVTHRDPRFWPEPEQFNPDRWAPEARATRPTWAYFPFGGGPRRCIGEQFAWMEATLLLATLAQHWQLRPAGDHRPALQPVITLRPRDGLWMRLEQRQPQTQTLMTAR